jgi:hypothetical protein
MPLHDWTRVEAGAFHGFHLRWIAAICGQLNTGGLPKGYYADAEQIIRPWEADVVTLSVPPTLFSPPSTGGVALAEAQPQVRVRQALRPAQPRQQNGRQIAIRHISQNRVVAIIEIVSPANKDRPEAVDRFVSKAVDALRAGVHLLILDLFPPGLHDPHGLYGAICDELQFTADDASKALVPPVPMNQPLVFAAFMAGLTIELFAEPRAVGTPVPTMPLFLSPERYVNVALADSYDRAWRETPECYREQLAAS